MRGPSLREFPKDGAALSSKPLNNYKQLEFIDIEMKICSVDRIATLASASRFGSFIALE